MNPVPFLFYRDQLTEMAARVPTSSEPERAPLVTETAPQTVPLKPVIEIRLAGVVVHVMPGVDTALPAEVLCAVRCSAPTLNVARSAV